MSTTSSAKKKKVHKCSNLPQVWPLTPQALQSGINLSRQAEQHYSLAAQILVSHSNDESLSHTMSSVSPQPPNNVRPIEQPRVLRGPRQPETPWSHLIVPPETWRSSLVPSSRAYTRHRFCVATQTQTHTHMHTRPQTTNLNSVHPTVHFLTASEMFSSCQGPTVIVREQEIQQNNNHVITNLGYVSTVRTKLFGLLHTRHFIYCFSFCFTLKSGTIFAPFDTEPKQNDFPDLSLKCCSCLDICA